MTNRSSSDMWLTEPEAFEYVRDKTEECPDVRVLIEACDMEGSFQLILISRHVPDENVPYKTQNNLKKGAGHRVYFSAS